MTSCDQIRERLTGYLDGDLSDDRGSVVRGHLRECAKCREVARDEAALRDGLRQLPSVEPPAAMWAGIQDRLAAAEVADAKQPRWRLTVARWRKALATPTGRIGMGAVAMAAILLVVYWRTHRPEEVATGEPIKIPMPEVAPSHENHPPPAPIVTPNLTGDQDETTTAQVATIDDLMTDAKQARLRWTDAQRTAFDQHVKTLRDGIAHAKQAKVRHRAQSSLIIYLQRAVVRDDVASADPRGTK